MSLKTTIAVLLLCVPIMLTANQSARTSVPATRTDDGGELMARAEPQLLARRRRSSSEKRLWLKKAQKRELKGAILASNISWLFLGTSMISVPIALEVNPFAGAILSICSLGGWTISHVFAFVPYSEAAGMFKYNSHAQRFRSDPGTMTAIIGHLTAYIGGLGALTFSSLAISMASFEMLVITATFSTMSWLGGIVGNIATYVHGSTYLAQSDRLILPQPSLARRELDRISRIGSSERTLTKRYRASVLSLAF